MHKKYIAVILCMLVLTGCTLATPSTESPEEEQYNVALSFFQEGDYISAVSAFEHLGDYKDSAGYVDLCYERLAANYMHNSEYVKAAECYFKINKASKYDEVIYACAESLRANKLYCDALPIFEKLGNFRNAAEYAQQLQNPYQALLDYIEENGYKDDWGRYYLADKLSHSESYEMVFASEGRLGYQLYSSWNMQPTGNSALYLNVYVTWQPGNICEFAIGYEEEKGYIHNSFFGDGTIDISSCSIIAYTHERGDMPDDQQSTFILEHYKNAAVFLEEVIDKCNLAFDYDYFVNYMINNE